MMGRYIENNLKGTVGRDFFDFFFLHQTVLAGPIKHFLKPFGILTKFYGVIQVLKLLPGVRYTRESISKIDVGNFF